MGRCNSIDIFDFTTNISNGTINMLRIVKKSTMVDILWSEEMEYDY